MKVVVIGGTGLIGSKLIARLVSNGHDAVAAALQTGVNTMTGQGLDDAVAGADVVVDVSNSPSFADDDVMSFFVTSTGNILEADRRAGVRHHVALSVVGTGSLPDSGYLRAKAAQEELIETSGVPYSIVRATQFFEFTTAIADASMVEGTLRLAPVHYQPMAADDVAAALSRVAVGEPLDGVKEIGGPDRVRMDQFIAAALARAGDVRELVVDEHARYFNTELDDDSLVPGAHAELGTTTYETWLKETAS
ncbi:MAG TPA: SDR family oxidoreductase [Marmoricola sp.]